MIKLPSPPPHLCLLCKLKYKLSSGPFLLRIPGFLILNLDPILQNLLILWLTGKAWCLFAQFNGQGLFYLVAMHHAQFVAPVII